MYQLTYMSAVTVCYPWCPEGMVALFPPSDGHSLALATLPLCPPAHRFDPGTALGTQHRLNPVCSEKELSLSFSDFL